ncbi:carbon storage regulator CsrA [Planomicrobium sp. MB-3u-38]|uniref:carbon storage regulator CsrA n=1 Tax=Planomicrobium sp. MB-3u-38 TaxID=2058318 RepID=UPI000C7DAEF0|nr:carbon storage regulator CsrA [Planomicrobium sp. MB-3u-38]PKH10355.1 carbon storage regulator [Planomicrobium sp. MB-3u-38]
MLVLGRKKGESIIIDDQIEVIVTSVEGETVKLGIEAPKHITIHRKEVYLEIQEENKKAMSNVIDIGDFLKMKK